MSARSVQKVIRYLESRKVSVRKGRENVYYPEEKVIVYNASGSYKAQLYTLLHEAGHFLQQKSRNFNVHNLIYQDEIYTKYKKYRILEQEIDAWNRGLNLSKKLSIKIDDIDYRKTAAYFVMFYVKSLAND